MTLTHADRLRFDALVAVGRPVPATLARKVMAALRACETPPRDPCDPHGELTDRQSHVLRFISTFMGANGYAPSIREIGAAVGINEATTHHHLGKLAASGHITRVPGSPRAISLADPGSAP